MNVSILIRTCTKDIPWLRYCLTALMARATGFREIVVACLPGDAEDIRCVVNDYPVRLVIVDQVCGNDYIGQQLTKCQADLYTVGDYVMHIDSDCIATKPFTPDEFFVAARPRVLWRNWADVGDAIAWRLPTEQVLGHAPPYETMACHPMVHSARALERFRRHVARQHGKDFDRYVAGLAEFSEFNAIGNFLYLFEPMTCEWAQADPATDNYPRPLRQFRTWDGITPETRAEIEQLLQ